VNKLLSTDICEFVFSKLEIVQSKVLAKVADREKLAKSFMDPETRKGIENQQKEFE
jgi:hypothetical protein